MYIKLSLYTTEPYTTESVIRTYYSYGTMRKTGERELCKDRLIKHEGLHKKNAQ